MPTHTFIGDKNHPGCSSVSSRLAEPYLLESAERDIFRSNSEPALTENVTNPSASVHEHFGINPVCSEREKRNDSALVSGGRPLPDANCRF